MKHDFLRTLADNDPAISGERYDAQRSRQVIDRIISHGVHQEPATKGSIIMGKIKESMEGHKIRWAVPVAAAATIALGISIVPNLLNLDGKPGGPSAQAAVVLAEAADNASNSKKPEPKPGQYWKVETFSAYGEMEVSDNVESHSVISQEDTEYLPTDGKGESYVVSGPRKLYKHLYGPQRATVGDGAGIAKYTKAQRDLMNSSSFAEEYKKLPRDADALWKYMHDNVSGSASRDEAMFVFVSDRLREGNVPADLRSAMYKALAKVDGVTVTDDNVSVAGKKAVAVARVEPSRGLRDEILFDKDTKEYLGERSTQVQATNNIPAGTVTAFATSVRTLVDSVPADVVKNAKAPTAEEMEGYVVHDEADLGPADLGDETSEPSWTPYPSTSTAVGDRTLTPETIQSSQTATTGR